MSDAFLGSRLTYARQGLGEQDLLDDPVALLQAWLRDAEAENVLEPTAMCLATADPSGMPNARMVLLRQLDSRGLVFFTNYLSAKGQELEACPQAAACFWWGPLERQVRARGRIEKVSAEESDAYFASRPPDSRRASAASPQSQPVASAEELRMLLEATPEAPDRPEHWGGFRLIPCEFEFWQGRPARLHDRFRYTLAEGKWSVARLAP